MKYLSIQTFQCGITVSGAATFTAGATINVLALNGATTSSEASLFLGAHGTLEGGQLVLQKGTTQTYAAHLDNYNNQFRILYGTDTSSTGSALIVDLANRQLVLPAYTSSTSFSGTAAGYLAFDSSGNIITTTVPVSGVSSIIAGTGVTVSSGTGNVTVSIGQSVATSATPSFDQIFLTNNGNGTNVKIGDDAWIGDVNAANSLRIMGQQNNADGYIIFGNSNFTALGRSGTGNLTYGGSTVWTAATLTNLNQLTNGPGYITSAALAGYVPTSRTLTINGTSYDLSADRTWTITTPFVSKLQHSVKAGVAINKGQAVYVTGADGTNMIVGLASNASEATSSKTMGLLDATVSTNGFANVVTEGLLAGLDTSTAGTEGDPVWLGTGGNLIYGLINKPYAPAHLVFIGIVTRKNNSNGEIFVKVQNGFELDELHDVDLKTTAPINGHLLGFNGTLWVNKTIAGWLGYTPANASGTTNYLSKFTGSTTLGNSLVYDNGTNVGIGTTSPGAKLHVVGNTYIQSGTLFLNSIAGYSANSVSFGDGATTFSFVSSGSQSFAFTGGNVGIGTTTPSYKLEVNGGPINIINGYSDPTAEAGYRLKFADNGGINNDSGIGLSGSLGSESLWINKGSANGNIRFMFGTLGEKVTFTSAGNVGIGTTNPLFTLDVNGITKLRTATYFGQISQPSAPTLGTNSPTGGTLPADTYTYRISALDFWNAETTPSNSLVVTTTGSTSSVSMSWPLVQGAYNYRIYRTNSGGTTVYYTVSGTNSTSFTDTGAAGTVGVTASVNGTAYGFFNTNGTFRSGNIVIANNGVGNTSSITFDKSTDGPSINVVEYANDSTMFEFALRDNPDGGSDFFHWVMPDWQNSSSGWKPLKFSNFVTQIVGQSSNFWSSFSLPSSTPYYTTNPESLANASIKWDPYTSTSYNLPKDNGTGTGVFNVDITGFTGTNNTIYWVIIQAGATTFNWGTGWSGNTPVGTGVAITGGWQTLGDGVQVRIIGSVAASDRWAFRAFPVPKMGIGTTTPLAPLQISSTVRPTSTLAQGVYANPTLVATANNDTLVGLDINPTFTNGAFTGVNNIAVRAYGRILSIYDSPYDTTALNSNFVLQHSNGSQAGIAITSDGALRVKAPGGSPFVIITGSVQTWFNRYSHSSIQAFSTDFGIYGASDVQKFRIFNSTGNVLIQNGGTFTDSGYKLDVNGTGIFRDNLKLTTGVLSFDGVTSYWGNSIKYESGQIRVYQSGDIHAAFGGGTNTLKGNTNITTSGGTNVLLAYSSYVQAWQTFYVSQSGGTHNFVVSNASSGGNAYFNNVNVGIGTASPTAKFEVYGADNTSSIKLSFPSGNTLNTYTGIVFSGESPKAGILFASNAAGYARGSLIFATSSSNDYTGINLTHEKMRITDIGNVGIGTSSPAEKLHVVGDGLFTATGTKTTKIVGTDSSIEVEDGLSIFNKASNYGWLINSDSSNNFGIYNWNRNGYVFNIKDNAANGAFTISGSNIGIGITTPPRKLSVIGDSEWTEWQYWGSASNTYTFALGRTTATAYTGVGEAFVILRESSGYSTAFLIDNDTGNIGIGTISPSQKLDVSSNGGRLRISQNISASVFNGLEFADYTGGVDGGLIWNQNTGEIRLNAATSYFPTFYSSGVETMRIATGGQVIVGGTTVGYAGTKLQVGNTSDSQNGLNILTSTTGYGYILFGDGAGANTYVGQIWYYHGDNYMGFQTNGSEKMRITAAGNVLVGTATDSGYKLQVAGNQLITTTGNTSSTTGFKILNSSGSTMFHVLDNGNVGININAEVSSSYSLRVNGGIWANSFEQLQTLNGSSGVGRIEYYNTGGSHRTLGFRTYGSHPAESVKGFIEISSQVLTYTGIGNVVLHADADFADHPTLVLRSLNTSADSFYMQNYHHSQGALFITKADTGGDSSMRFRPGRSSDILVISTSGILVNGVITATGGSSTNWNTAYSWGNHSSAGYVPQARTLTINGTTYDLSANRSWTIATTTPGGSNTQFQYNSSGTLAGASALTYNSATNRVGINQASPGYDLDVNGQVRVQDKLRVGNVNSGNGVVHMSSTATINPSATTIVWSQNVSVGMCAFIEYYILNDNTTTDQRAGTIMVTWNQSGTPTIAHTETTTPDIGSTTAINFTSSLVGSDARINAVSSSPHPYTMVMSYKYF